MSINDINGHTSINRSTLDAASQTTSSGEFQGRTVSVVTVDQESIRNEALNNLHNALSDYFSAEQLHQLLGDSQDDRSLADYQIERLS